MSRIVSVLALSAALALSPLDALANCNGTSTVEECKAIAEAANAGTASSDPVVDDGGAKAESDIGKEKKSKVGKKGGGKENKKASKRSKSSSTRKSKSNSKSKSK